MAMMDEWDSTSDDVGLDDGESSGYSWGKAVWRSKQFNRTYQKYKAIRMKLGCGESVRKEAETEKAEVDFSTPLMESPKENSSESAQWGSATTSGKDGYTWDMAVANTEKFDKITQYNFSQQNIEKHEASRQELPKK